MLDRGQKMCYSNTMKMRTGFLVLMLCGSLYAGTVPSKSLLAAMRVVESRNDPHAYNKREGAVGLYQVRAEALKDINARHKTKYSLCDFYRRPELGEWAVCAYGRMYGAKSDKDFAMIWNGGPNGRRKQRAAAYWLRVKKVMNGRR